MGILGAWFGSTAASCSLGGGADGGNLNVLIVLVLSVFDHTVAWIGCGYSLVCWGPTFITSTQLTRLVVAGG